MTESPAGARRGRWAALASFAVALALVLGGALALRRRIAEEWHLWRLGSADEIVREDIIDWLGESGSARCAPTLKWILVTEASRRTSNHALHALLRLGQVAWAPLGHASEELTGLKGMAGGEVLALLGPPREKRTADFSEPMYGLPRVRPDFDEQWVYLACLEHALVYFKAGRVVLAIDEWSDF